MKCDSCGEEMVETEYGYTCNNCGLGISYGILKRPIKSENKESSSLIVRKNYDKVISSLYRALYSNEPLTDDELKLIIEYVMEEYK